MAAQIRVLFTTWYEDDANSYVRLLVSALPADVAATSTGMRRLLFGRYDVVHLHWPEYLVRSTRRRSALMRPVLLLILLRWWITGTPVVQTVHNAQPHEKLPSIEQWLLAQIERSVTVNVNMTDEVAREGKPSRLIPHGHYRDHFARACLPEAREQALDGNVLLFFGQLRRYKNVERLLRAFADLPRDARALWRLEILASPVPDDDLIEEVRALAGRDERVSLQLARFSDGELMSAVRRSTAVVLPYSYIGNSGALLTALSLDRPVLASRSHAVRKMADEVGHEWIVEVADSWSANELARGLRAIISTKRGRGSVPDLSTRAWDKLGWEYAETYRDAIAEMRARGLRGVVRRGSIRSRVMSSP